MATDDRMSLSGSLCEFDQWIVVLTKKSAFSFIAIVENDFVLGQSNIGDKAV